MSSANIKLSGFSLAKEKKLRGDDYYDMQILDDLCVAVLCDGVGSATEGAEAAKRVVSHILENFRIRPKSWSMEKTIKSFIRSINAILYQESQINYQRSEIVTTLALVVIQGNKLYGANIGDSRIYLLRDNSLEQLSIDHIMNEAGYENVLTQAIGIAQEVEPYYFENITQKGDNVLLCSDGLYNVLPSNQLQKDILYGASALVKGASRLKNDNLPDDTTAVVLEVLQVNELEVLKQQNLPIIETLRTGESIDGYILKKPLIQNERTWLCEKEEQLFVLKFPPVNTIDDPLLLDLFVKEAWNANRLEAEFFPDAFIPEKRCCRYYVMEYLEGENLATYLKNKRVSIDDAVKLAKTLLQMSQYLINRDLVHGDIKPENILVMRDEKGGIYFKVIDFGSITEVFSTNSKAGTPNFLSPQRFQNEAISETSEIFAIGVTLYLALTNKYPYGEIEPFQTPSFKEARKASSYNNNIPNWLESVILRAIALKPERRYTYFSEMLYELQSPSNVKPYFNEHASLIERSPVMFYRIAFTIMTLLNMILLALLLR